jgi:hypothetical protein
VDFYLVFYRGYIAKIRDVARRQEIWRTLLAYSQLSDGFKASTAAH